MSTFPPAVLAFLQEQLIDTQAPAFLLLADDGTVVDWGGALGAYGIHDLERGVDVAERVPLLQGLLPLGVAREGVPLVETDAGAVADVDLFRGAEGTWVVLRNVTPAVERERALQQSRNAMQLLERSMAKQEAAKGAPGGLLPNALAALGIAIFEPLGTDRFRLLAAPPQWLGALWPDITNATDECPLHEHSPFLRDFLEEADGCWQTGSGSCRAGPWTEVDALGRDWHLEAVALSVQGRSLLAIVDVGQSHREKTALLQRAREHVLGHQRLLKDLEKKDVLLHCIVHDLRTPMVSAHAALQLLATETLPYDARRAIVVGRTELERQDLLIRSILDVFAADLNELESRADAAPVDVADCAAEVVDAFRPAFQLRGINLALERTDAEPPGGWGVVAERTRLVRVLANLVDNALRHSRRDTTVAVGLAVDGEGVFVTVDDEGPGVPADLQPRLFDRFSHGGPAGNIGLGLHFCRVTIEGWGGRIGQENRAGGGSRFWFRLPQSSGRADE
ncbi:MAG: HAMP domain-containing histidine kinase [Gemmatimonadota bacterium]|nr:HAMP domain-containing histidine kinase [Gemmatimonadota bacterium]MDH3367418.1 HAMP domain-containing histidine kinase [Gemmatimonadota bacterium]MDH3478576.1 HAMP domain-containing histidine kinase [Gemmatimonadota bacterium]MDH3568981.1 HAMP domain-containing histidine kinase [Gemmatimonadota bacterium]MDH5548378.1 HAMP domain-containing histidine kinase [Gemmatimonadota bacterium]